MSYDPGYTKANITYEANAVLNKIAKKEKRYAYQILDEVLREKYPEQFKRIGALKQ